MNIFTIIQGPLIYVNDINTTYNGNNIIVSTWNRENHYNLTSSFTKIINEYPEIIGINNVFLQCKSTLNGISEAQRYDATHILKIRSDIFISPFDKFLDILKNIPDRLSFLFWCNHNNGYLGDYINFGTVDDMLKFWNLPTTFPASFPEKMLTMNFFKTDNFDEIYPRINLILDTCFDNNINIYWKKHNVNVTAYRIQYPLYITK